MRRCEMVGRVVLAALVLVMLPGVASAQVTGWANVSFGKTSGGDTTDDGNAFAVSAAAFEGRGWFGAEVELAHSTRFNDERLADSGLSTLMANVIVSPHEGRFQPYAVGGVGLIRARGCVAVVRADPEPHRLRHRRRRRLARSRHRAARGAGRRALLPGAQAGRRLPADGVGVVQLLPGHVASA